LASALSTEVLYKWDINKYNTVVFAESQNDTIAFFEPSAGNLVIYDLNPTTEDSNDDGLMTRKQKIGGIECGDCNRDGQLFFYEDLLISCSSTRMIAWSTENGTLQYSFQFHGDRSFKWAQSQDRIYALELSYEDVATLHTFKALDGCSLNNVELVFHDTKMQLNVVDRLFVCGNWLVVPVAYWGLLVFDLEYGGVQKSFTSLSGRDCFVQSSDDPFKFCGVEVENTQVLTFHCDQDCGLLQQVSAFSVGHDNYKHVVAAFDGCSVVAGYEKLIIYDAVTGAEKKVFRIGPHCSVRRAHVSNHRRELVVVQWTSTTRTFLHLPRRRGPARCQRTDAPTVTRIDAEIVIYGLETEFFCKKQIP